jgi:energy-coupling factor transporter ATP-binding protein EcfA2
MLERLCVDNFRCLVNFELKLDRLNLLIGVNGSGKSSVFEVLRKIQDFATKDKVVSEVFSSYEKTLWLKKDIQRFELDVSVDDDCSYSYKLDIEHDDELKKAKVTKEYLGINGKPLFDYSEGMAHLYKDDHTISSEYPFNLWSSAVGYFGELKQYKKLSRFKRELERFIIIRPIPDLMEKSSPDEDSQLSDKIQNFPSWYRYASQADGELGIKLAAELGNVLPGFRSLDFSTLGENYKLLKVNFDSPNSGKLSLNFTALSDGQKMLIALYALIAFSSLQEKKVSLFIDEPDNFLALREIQPWLSSLVDECGDTIEQSVLISHHPGMIDYLGGDGYGLWFMRQGTGPVQVRKEPKQIIDGLSLSETVARGWEE